MGCGSVLLALEPEGTSTVAVVNDWPGLHAGLTAAHSPVEVRWRLMCAPMRGLDMRSCMASTERDWHNISLACWMDLRSSSRADTAAAVAAAWLAAASASMFSALRTPAPPLDRAAAEGAGFMGGELEGARGGSVDRLVLAPLLECLGGLVLWVLVAGAGSGAAGEGAEGGAVAGICPAMTVAGSTWMMSRGWFSTVSMIIMASFSACGAQGACRMIK